MRNRLLGAMFGAVGVLACSALLLAQNAKQPAASSTDLTGLWATKQITAPDPNRVSATRGAGAEVSQHPDGYLPTNPPSETGMWEGPLPMQPWAKSEFDYNRDPDGYPRNEMNPSYANCYPKGPTTAWGGGVWNFEIIQSPRRVFVLYEWGHQVRQIWTDGREHPKDWDATWMGHSIGHWEGDTLVADTIGMKDKTWLDGAGHVHSDKMHLIERIRRVDPETMSLQMTVDDPKAYTAPFNSKVQLYQLKPNWEIEESIICEDKLLGSPILLH